MVIHITQVWPTSLLKSWESGLLCVELKMKCGVDILEMKMIGCWNLSVCTHLTVVVF